ncbi:uncharacterized protein LOC116021877 isoform X2 [Ipomoea triloba]|uniref:uncharacterized protein LOC109190900 n=1 Tax=Ipomoea nil TaxID=35883 RepID=UPI0009019169|nr:PREDICTED: uncharacterized protein LOC109190900 [Ipomoea nil]XP_031118249.1 uncharacterized protein LOC116021877 isoform X2 [Ipomoea triloba]
MASRCRTLSRPAFNLIRSTVSKPTLKPNFSLQSTSSLPTLPRPLPQMGALQSLLPLYSAVSSARLTSCLGLDSKCSRSLSQELGLSVPR